jgi:hypothetical protein
MKAIPALLLFLTPVVQIFAAPPPPVPSLSVSGFNFSTTHEYWIILHADYQLRIAKQNVAGTLKQITAFHAA